MFGNYSFSGALFSSPPPMINRLGVCQNRAGLSARLSYSRCPCSYCVTKSVKAQPMLCGALARDTGAATASVCGSSPATSTRTRPAATMARLSSWLIRESLSARSASNQPGWVMAECVYWFSTVLHRWSKSWPSSLARAQR